MVNGVFMWWIIFIFHFLLANDMLHEAEYVDRVCVCVCALCNTICLKREKKTQKKLLCSYNTFTSQITQLHCVCYVFVQPHVWTWLLLLGNCLVFYFHYFQCLIYHFTWYLCIPVRKYVWVCLCELKYHTCVTF